MENAEFRPRKVLLLGNGINRAFDGLSWETLLREIADPSTLVSIEDLNSPMPLRAILITKDNVKERLSDVKDKLWGKVSDSSQRTLLKSILTAGFDDILTTNYGYELEAAAVGVDQISKTRITKMEKRAGLPPKRKFESKYLLHTYHEVTCEGKTTRIWHIHGEIRKPDSVYLGHYWYGSGMGVLFREMKRKANYYQNQQKKQKPISYHSWVDSFLLGDVYVLGAGFDFSELDLWWLLNRKKTERARKGGVIFYDKEIDAEANREKKELLKLFGVCVGPMRGWEKGKDDVNEWQAYYRDAVADIRRRIQAPAG